MIMLRYTGDVIHKNIVFLKKPPASCTLFKNHAKVNIEKPDRNI